MSAWLCSDTFIKQIVCTGLARRDDYYCMAYAMGKRGKEMEDARLYPDEFATEVAILLRAENYRSVNAHYADGETHFGDPLKADPLRITLGELEQCARIPIGYALKMLACYEYQACEASDWETTLAHKICGMIRRNLSDRTPGYEAAPWGDPFEFNAPAPYLISLTALANEGRRAAARK